MHRENTFGTDRTDTSTRPARDDVVLLHRLDDVTSYLQAQRMSAELLDGVPRRPGETAERPVEHRIFTYHPFARLLDSQMADTWCRSRLAALQAGRSTDAVLIEEAVWAEGERGFALALITDRGTAELLLAAVDDPGKTSSDDESGWLLGTLPEPESRVGHRADAVDWDVLSLLTSAPDDRPAVIDDEVTLTYRELRERSLAIARDLRQHHGVGPGDRIALVGGRDAGTSAHILGAWLAGAAWCAVDRGLPQERRAMILDTLRPCAVVDTSTVPTAPLAGPPSRSVVPADDVAYFVATSGSTGRPKVAAIPAGGLRPLLHSWTAYYGLDEPHRVLQIGSWEGDVFLGDLLKALGSGGTLVIAPHSRRADAEYLADTVVEQHISFLETTPTLMRAVLRSLAGRESRLVVAVVGSDTFRMEEARQLRRLSPPGTRLVNGYGLTECTIESVVFDCADLERLTDLDHGLCPIGEPLPGTALRVVDPETGHTLPRGAVGELVIDSPGVTLGYLGPEGVLPERGPNASRFRTGDLVSLHRDGVMHFHGRSDTRVKVRGHRIELGDVDNALLRIPGVSEAYVCTFERHGMTELAAFVGTGPQTTEAELRSALLERIPATYVPVRFYFRAELPRLHNGKLDRVSMNATAQQQETIGDLPDDLTGRVRHCWESVLGHPVRTDATFFDQGGTSLLVITLVELLREVLGPEHSFAVADLFRHPTVDSFVDALRDRAKPRDEPAPNPERSGRRELLEALARDSLSVEEALERIRTL
ncbi:non-ribosomal peptide synthetase [Streptomyces sp. IBSBF 2953]|nr:non-ribosomal peptide synthetase [Streptomyces hayashii]